MSHLHNWADIEADAANPSVVKRRLEGRGADMVRVEIAAGTEADRHSHPHEQFVQVLSGRGTLETAAGREPFRAGSIFHFPAETWHAAIFDEATVLVETNFKTP